MPDERLRPANIAVFHLNQIGDLVFSLPTLVALRAGFPEARISSVVRETVAPLLEGSSLVDDLLMHRGSRDFAATAERLRSSRLDLAVCLSESPRSRLLAFLSRAPHRVGLAGGPLSGLLTSRVDKDGLPSTRNNLRVARELSCPIPTDSYIGLLESSAEDRRAARELLQERHRPDVGGRLVVLAPEVSKGRENKCWPAERFAEVARRVGAEPGLHAVFVGSAPGVCFESVPEGCLDLGGRTDLRQLLGLLAMSELFVGNDSGVLHLAACLGVPCVGLFGPTDPAETGPQGGPHRVLGGLGDEMSTISVAAVSKAVHDLLALGEAAGELDRVD